jgi:nitroreductase
MSLTAPQDAIMDEEMLYQTIFKRKSIRKYEPASLDPGTMETVLSQIPSLRPMIPGIRTEIRIMKDEEVKGMFKAAAPHYLAIYSEVKEGHLANAGFLLQQFDLFFSANGIGSCWLGGSKPTKKVEAVPGMEFIVILAFGRPAETLQRSSFTEFKRRPLSDISDIKGLEELMEPVRLAPSGVNNQSWYYRGDADRIDAYYAKSMITDQMNQINLGIGMCHLWLSLVHHKRTAEMVVESPGDDRTPKGYRYMVSAKMR